MKSIREQLKNALNEIDQKGNKKCINCSLCEESNRPEFAKCGAMVLINGNYIPKPYNSTTGFMYGDSAYISLLIQNDVFPNKNGNCQHYVKKWWMFCIK